MTELTRRTLLGGSAAAGAALALGPISQAQAAASATGKQAPGVYRMKVGDFEITQLSDGWRSFPPPDNFVRNLSKDRFLAAIEAAYLPKGVMTIPFNPMVVNTGSKLVLIDTGYGPGVGPTAGLLPGALAAAGIDPKAIDIVLLTHLHPDHVLGLKTADGGNAFPNAEVKAPVADWAYWMNDDNMNKAEGMLKTFFGAARKGLAGLADKVTRFEWNKEVAPGITSIDARGHTPGHTAFAISSGSGKLLVQADITNIPQLFLPNPDWQIIFDMDPQQSVQTRRKFHDMASTEKVLVAGFHFFFPAVGYVEKDGNGYRLVPVPWSPAI
jgi:glyoxylase-like metal-dependent hydrolase (beta-lactamase superfamily II)